MSAHSVVPLLNDLLGSVVEHKPDDVLTYLIEYLTTLQDDVTRARQMLERRSKGGATSAVAVEGASEAVVARSPSPSAVAEQTSPQPQPQPQRRLIEVRVDGEVRLIPDFEADDTPDVAVSGAGEGLDAPQPSGSASASPTPARSQSVVGGVAAPLSPMAIPAASIIVQDALAVRYLLKAAERQKTPSLSMVVDLARAKASAMAAAGPAGGRRQAAAAANNLFVGIEMLQRSSAGDQYQSLSILNNHWMVRQQMVFAVDGADSNDASMLQGRRSPLTPAALAEPSSTSLPPHSPALSSSGAAPSPMGASAPQRMILVQDPTPIRLLLKAAERQKTPSLSLLTDFARLRYGGDAAVTAPPPQPSAGAVTAIRGEGGSSSPSPAAAVTNHNLLGIELLQRSHAESSGLPSLGILANHWMVRRQIVVAVKANGEGPLRPQEASIGSTVVPLINAALGGGDAAGGGSRSQIAVQV